jgi:hypothetical protein
MTANAATLADPSVGVSHPSWCDPYTCRVFPGGDVIHATEPGYWVTNDTQFEVQVVQIHEAGAPIPDAPHLLLTAPLPRGSGCDDAHELTARDARGLADQLRTYADLVGV